ncbi:B-cell receptor CD22-like [Oncorhynchus clarkii lewisi]|uniref:B-cell receptor CD22-like n=1 Tax=Oncorhynchus clarkii lewisi TaxID=490388 RepID=UPI0039B9991E
MALRTAGSVLVVFLWSVAVVLGQDGWSVTYTTQSICTFKESTVELSCSYTYPSGTVTTAFWYTESGTGKEPEDLGQDPEYAGRLEYHEDKKNGHTLRITDLRESDSAEYKFRFITDQTGGKYIGSPGVTLSVTGIQVKVTGGHQDKTLTCSTTCTLTDNPTYIWYKNGHKVKEDTSSLYSDSFSDADSYSCAVKGREDLHSPAVCQKCWSVTYTHQNICALKGSTVNISCSYTYPSNHEIKTAFWFTKWSDKDAEDLSSVPGYEGHIEYLGDKESDCTLRITDLRLRDSAGYMFRFITSGEKFSGSPVSLTVTDLQVKVTTTLLSTTLTCSTTCTLTGNPTYIWYRNSKIVQEASSPSYSFYFKTEDSFYCAVKGIKSPAVSVEGHSYFHVTYTYQRICTLNGSSVDISCSYTYPSGHTVSETIWYKKGKLNEAPQILSPGYGGRVEYLGNMQSDSILRITDLREEDSAEYKIRFRTDKTTWEPTIPGTTLTVTGLQVKVTPPTVTEGQKVTLTCSTTCTLGDNPTYIWYKNGHVTNQSTSLFLNPVSSEDAGRYSCSVEGHEDLPSAEETLTVRYGPKNTSVSVSPSGEIVEGSSVTLTCSSDANPPVDKYTWYKKNVASPKASGQSYSITNIISEDRGEYYCEAQNGKGSMNSTALMIIVAGKPTSFMTAAVGIIVVVLVLILCLSGFMWFRKKASKSTSDTRDTSENVQGDSSPVYDNISSMAMTSTAAQTADTDNQDYVHYASIHFSGSKNQEVPLYSTVQLPQPQIQDEDVQYAAVKFSRPSAATR